MNIYIYIHHCQNFYTVLAQTKERNMAAELPIDEVAHGNMPVKGTKGFLPECKVQDFPPEPEMACMKISCFFVMLVCRKGFQA